MLLKIGVTMMLVSLVLATGTVAAVVLLRGEDPQISTVSAGSRDTSEKPTPKNEFDPGQRLEIDDEQPAAEDSAPIEASPKGRASKKPESKKPESKKPESKKPESKKPVSEPRSELPPAPVPVPGLVGTPLRVAARAGAGPTGLAGAHCRRSSCRECSALLSAHLRSGYDAHHRSTGPL
jgi:hypothetical protein